MTIYLHVGAEKCASSALQAALSRSPVLSTGSRRVEYAAIRPGGHIKRKDALRSAAARTPNGYVISLRAVEVTSDTLLSMQRNLSQALEETDDIIFSNEGWLTTGRALADRGFTDQFPVPGEVICYVRPQVEYLNSAWWQWGAWRFDSFDKFLAKYIARSMWHSQLSYWKSMPRIRAIRCRPLPADIISDFKEVIGLPDGEIEAGQQVNVALPATILRLYQKYPHLREKSATDFLLSRHVHLTGDPTPWVIDRTTARQVVDHCREDNKALLAMLEPDVAQRVESDPRWWDSASFFDRPVQQPLYSDDAIDKESLSELCRLLIEAVKRLDDTAQRA